MASLEKQFEEELIGNCEVARQKSNYNPTRTLQRIEKFGGVKTAKEILRKGQTSDGFAQLKEAGLMNLSLEATVIQGKYGALFSDEEVNHCYAILVEYGYY